MTSSFHRGKRITFTEFLRSQRHREGPVGDLASDWLSDTNNRKPRGAYKWSALERFLNSRGAVPGCIEAAKTAWSEWQNLTIADYTRR